MEGVQEVGYAKELGVAGGGPGDRVFQGAMSRRRGV